MSKSYVERKEAWALKMRARSEVTERQRSEERLPPGQHMAKGFPVLDLGIHPEISLEEWKLEFSGEVENPVTLDWAAYQALPRIEDVSDFHCVTTWSKFDCQWGGVRFSELIDLVQPKADAAFVFYTSHDGYTTNTRLEDLLDAEVLLASEFEGEPLTVEHGGPVRVVIPKLYAWKSAKFVKSIEFRREDELGFWEKRGYSNTADPWLEDRFAS